MTLLNLIAIWVLLGLSLFLTGLFIYMWSADSIRVCEDNIAIRIVELVAFALLSLFALERFIKGFRELKKKAK